MSKIMKSKKVKVCHNCQHPKLTLVEFDPESVDETITDTLDVEFLSGYKCPECGFINCHDGSNNWLIYVRRDD